MNTTFNMFNGNPVLVRLKVANVTVEYIQRALPEARIISENTTHTLMEVIVAGEEGILRWIFNQRQFVEVLSPQSLRERVKDSIKEMVKLYDM